MLFAKVFISCKLIFTIHLKKNSLSHRPNRNFWLSNIDYIGVAGIKVKVAVKIWLSI